MPLWPASAAPSNAAAEHDTTTPASHLEAGKRVTRLTDTVASLALFQPAGVTEAVPAVLVFPGGGYQILAYDLEGTEVCSWLNSIRVTCVLVKYRVPRKGRYPEDTADLEDAQQAMQLTRSNSAQWKIDPARIGVLGFSAGAHLAAVLSNHPAPGTAAPAFAAIIYPGYLAVEHSTELAPGLTPSASTPPTFLLQAEDDPVDVQNVLTYFQALKSANVPAELHIFAQGGHGYGLRPTSLPISAWPALAERWLHTIHMLVGGFER